MTNLKADRIVNLTPHDICVRVNSETVVFKSMGTARVKEVPGSTVGFVDNGAVIRAQSDYGIVEWPDQINYVSVDGVIVSTIVAQEVMKLPATKRPVFWILTPDSSPVSVERDEKGQIKSISGLILHTQ